MRNLIISLLFVLLLRPPLPPPQEWRPVISDKPTIIEEVEIMLEYIRKPDKPDKPKKPKKHPKRQPHCLHPERLIYDPDTLCLPDQP